jgi:hypothetical protein
MKAELKSVKADQLEIAYYESGPANGASIILMHGFPYDPHAYDDIAEALSNASYRVANVLHKAPTAHSV